MGTNQEAESITFVCEKCEEDEEPRTVQMRKNQTIYKRLFKKAFPWDEQMAPTPKKKLKVVENSGEVDDGFSFSQNTADESIKKKITDYFPSKGLQDQLIDQASSYPKDSKKKKEKLKQKKKLTKLQKKKQQDLKKKPQEAKEEIFREKEEIFVENRDDEHPLKLEKKMQLEHLKQQEQHHPPQVKVAQKRGRKKKADKLKMEEEKKKLQQISDETANCELKNEESVLLELDPSNEEPVGTVEAAPENLNNPPVHDNHDSNQNNHLGNLGEEILIKNEEKELEVCNSKEEVCEEMLDESGGDQGIYRNKLRMRK